MTTTVVYVANTNVLELEGLKSAIEDTFVNDADVSFTIVDADGAEIAGQTWPWPMEYVAATDGNYRGIIKDTVEFTARVSYVARIIADAGPDRIGYWEFPMTPKTRTKE